MTKSDIVNEVSKATGLTKVETEVVIEGIIQSISNAMKRSERVDLRGFGSFKVKKRKARQARNPATQKIVTLKERYVPVFKVSNLLRKDVNNSLSK